MGIVSLTPCHIAHAVDVYSLAMTVLQNYPGEYSKVRCSGKAIQKVTAKHFKGLKPRAPDLPRVAETGIHVVKLDDEILEAQPKDHPAVTAIRADTIVSEEGQRAILNKWDELKQLGGPKYTAHSKNDNRSSTPALHCGVWNLSSDRPFVTADTRQKDAHPATRACLEELCELIKTHVAPRIKRMIQIHSPNLWPKHERCACLILLKVMQY